MKESTFRRVARVGLALYCVRLVAALFLALPLTAALGRRVAGLGGEQALFVRGGTVALELLDSMRGSLKGGLVSGGLVLTLAALGSLSPLGVVIARLSREASLGLAELLRAATRPFAGLAVLLGVATILGALFTLLASVTLHALATRFFATDERSADLAAVGADVLMLVPLVIVGIVHDVARCAHVARDLGFYEATARALAVVRRNPGVLGLGYGLRLVFALAAAAVGLGATLAIGVGDLPHLALSVAAQQLALLGVSILRASWLAQVLRIEARTPLPRPVSDP